MHLEGGIVFFLKTLLVILLFICIYVIHVIDSYDSIVLSGALGEGHIPCRGLDQMIRVVKPGDFNIAKNTL